MRTHPVLRARSLFPSLVLLATFAALGSCTSGGSDSSSFFVARFDPEGTIGVVYRDQSIELTFSDDVDPTSVSPAGFQVLRGSRTFQGRVTVEGNTITFFPTVLPGDRNDYRPPNAPPINGLGFDGNTEYTLKLPGNTPMSIRSRGGKELDSTFQSSFTTSTGFTPESVSVAPEVNGFPVFDPLPLVGGDPFSSNPHDWPLLDPTRVTITIPFSERIHPATLDPFSSVTLVNVTSLADPPRGIGEPALADVSLTPDAMAVTVRNLVSLGDDPTSANPYFYELTLSPGITDLAGNPLAFETVVRFRTADKPGERNYAVITETFDTQDQMGTSTALWIGNGILEGIGLSPRTVDFAPAETPFSLSHPLVQAGNRITPGGNRFMMKWETSHVNVAPGEAIVGMAWSPQSNLAFSSMYRDVTIRLGHMVPGDNLSVEYDQNWLGTPVTVFRGDYFVEPSLTETWIDWPDFTADLEYNGASDLVFEFESCSGGDTFQLFRNSSSGSFPRRRIFGPCNEIRSELPAENTVYWQRFFLVTSESFGVSRPYSTGLLAPEYGAGLVRMDDGAGAQGVRVQWGGSQTAGVLPLSAFQDDIRLANGSPYLSFLVGLTADPLSGRVPRVTSVSFAYTEQE